MPRDVGTGLYHYPEGTPGNPGQTVFSARYNTFINDLSFTLNTKLPVNMGGTGADDAAEARDNIKAEVKSVQVTDYNTHVWEPGSWYALASATAPPLPGLSFTGICYGSDAANITVVARVYSDSVFPGRVFVREKVAGVWRNGGAWSLDQSGAFVELAGDTMTGDLSITRANPTCILNDTSGGISDLYFNLNGLGRFLLRSNNDAAGSLVIYTFNDAGAAVGTALSIDRATARLTLTDPPLNPSHAATKNYVDTTTVSLAGDTMTGPLSFINNQGIYFSGLGAPAFYVLGTDGNNFRIYHNIIGDIVKIDGPSGTAIFNKSVTITGNTGDISSTGLHRLEVASAGVGNGAYMSFHIPGTFATNFGMGTDNALRYGGWSNGAFSWRVMHEGLNAPAFTTANLSIRSLAGTNSTLYFTDEGGAVQTAFYWERALARQRIDCGGQPFIFSAGGIAYKPGGGLWADSSDARIKNRLGNYDNGLDAILTLQPVRFTYKGNDTSAEPSSDPIPQYDEEGNLKRSKEVVTVPYPNSPHYVMATSAKEFIGLIAQDCEVAFPEMVTSIAGMIDGQPVTDLRELDTSPLIFALVNSIKALHARIEALEATQASPP